MKTSSFCSLGSAHTFKQAPPATADVARASLLMINRNLIIQKQSTLQTQYH